MSFEVLRNDIAQVEADVIVNPANPLPKIGDGAELAIYEWAGKKICLSNV